MMFQRRGPFISQREYALALRYAGQSRHSRDREEARWHRPQAPDAFGQPGKPKETELCKSDIR